MPSMRCRRSIAEVCGKDSPAPLDVGHAFAIDGERRSQRGSMERQSARGMELNRWSPRVGSHPAQGFLAIRKRAVES